MNVYAYVKDTNRFVDVFGLETCNVEKVRKLTDKIPDEYKKVLMCVKFSDRLKKMMIKENISGEILNVKTLSNEGMAANIWSDKFNGLISTNGIHKAIKFDDMVFDNLNPKGIKMDDWIKDLHSPLGHDVIGIKF